MLSPGFGGVRDVTLDIISHEQIQSNRVCCFQTLDVIFSKQLLSDSFSFQIIFSTTNEPQAFFMRTANWAHAILLVLS